MRNKIWFVLFFMFAALALVGIACRSGAPVTAPAPTATALPPTATLPAPPTPTVTAVPATPTLVPPTATPTPPSLDGDWTGKTSQDSAFEFRVENNQIVYFNFSYQGESGSCSYSGGFGDTVSAPVINNQFTFEWSDDSGKQVRIAGAFISDTQATGTLDFSDKSKDWCEISTQMAWNVLSASAIAAGTVVAPPTAQRSAQAVFDGNWEGENADGNQVSFKIVDKQITYVMFNYSVSTGSCSLSGAMGDSIEDGAIIDKSFSVELTDSDGRIFTFAGNFTSDTEAAGTIHVKGTPSSFCGAFETEMSWTATNTSAVGSVTPQPTFTAGVPTSAPATIDPIAVVEGFFNAINARDIEAALAFVDDNVIFTFGSPTNTIGKDGMREQLTTLVASGLTYTLSDVQAVGDTIVNFTATASDGTVYAASQALIANGKIDILKLK